MNDDTPALRKDAPILVLLALDVLFGAFMWGVMPPRVPIHWNVDGRVDGWGPSWTNAFLIPGIAIFVYLLFLFLPRIDPSRRNYAAFEGALRGLRFLLVGFLVFVHLLLVAASMGFDVKMDVALRAALGLLVAGFGTRLGRLKPNWFFGIRTPWTLANADVWEKTHRLAGTLWTIGGVILVPCALLPARTGLTALVAAIAVLAIVPTLYSLVLYRRIES